MEGQVNAVTRREVRNIVGRFRGGKLAPVMAVPFLGGEGGTLSQAVMVELDPIAGRLLTPVTVELTAVYVPVQAIDAIKDPEAQYAGMTEVVRQKLLSGTPLFATEAEGELSQRLGVVPRAVAGVLRVSEAARLAHNAAVNYLRKRRYAYAVEVLHSNTAMTPALISQTVLERLQGVLDPEDRVNGSVQLGLPDQDLRVRGIAMRDSGVALTTSEAVNETGDTGVTYTRWAASNTANTIAIKLKAGGTEPDVYAEFEGSEIGGISLRDFYNAEKQDRMVRAMRSMIENNPVDGEDQVLRWAHGINLEPGRHPFIIAERTAVFGQDYREATDGTSLLDDVAMSKMMVRVGFDAIVPTTELGGIVITFCSVKPDETLAAQPHPILSDTWGAINRVADMLKIDPVAVTMREVDADVDVGDETTVAFYNGYNGLKRYYVNYGFNRFLDPADIENKSALWQLAIPPSVTPENILYPDNLDHYPFADNLAEVARYACASTAAIRTPLVFGPTPVEEVAIVESEELFGPGE